MENKYDGGSDKVTILVAQKFRTAIKFGEMVINSKGQIMHEEHSSLESKTLDPTHPGKDTAKKSRYVDCRMFKKFETNTFLKQTTNFMTREGGEKLALQVNDLLRIRLYYRDHEYKTANYTSRVLLPPHLVFTNVENLRLFL